jgi:PAS domain S-box-containing protein
MALPTAISFFCSGGALLLAVLRRQITLSFAVFQMMTTGLGLILISAYLLGFTNLSLFGMGIQMAIHTAVAFVAYGSVMLVYAWQQNPDESNGLRRWGPAIATMAVLLFFISFVITSQNHSVFAKLIELSMGLIVSGLIGFAVYRLSDFKIAYKGLVLISIPLVFVLLFVAMVTRMKAENEEAQKWFLHTKEVIALSEALSRDLPNAQYVLRSYVMTGNSALAGPYYRIAQETPETINRLQALVKDNPQQSAKVHHLSELATDRLTILVNIERLMREGNREQAAEQVKLSYNREAWVQYLQELETFIGEEKRLDLERQSRIEQSWQKLNWLLSAGTMAAIMLTAMLVLLFSQSISNRLNILSENAHSLANGETLSAPLAGTDELADLDRVFHKMARAVKEANRKERALIDNAQDVICSIDADGKFVKVNPASLRVFGYESDELVGRRLIEMVAPGEVDNLRQVIESLVKVQSIDDFESRCLHKDGSEVNILWSASWVEEESLMFCVARNITERKRAEENYKQLHGILEQHSAQLVAANKELESFSYSVSHDLRAPLRHIDGFVSMLEKKSASSLSEDGRRYLGIISQSAKQMGHLIDDLLAFSRMGRAEMRKTIVNMQKLVDDVREDLQREVGERQIRWQIESLPEVQADPAMLRLVLTNLLSNAIKYTRPCKDAVIEIGSRVEEGNLRVFFVRDNGVGFDMRYIDKLFGVFQRLHRPDEFEGTGIGLANVRRIINRHGGSTWAEGKIDQGATFFFSIPCHHQANDEPYQGSKIAQTAMI